MSALVLYRVAGHRRFLGLTLYGVNWNNLQEYGIVALYHTSIYEVLGKVVEETSDERMQAVAIGILARIDNSHGKDHVV